jgi:hypothetical protein
MNAKLIAFLLGLAGFFAGSCFADPAPAISAGDSLGLSFYLDSPDSIIAYRFSFEGSVSEARYRSLYFRAPTPDPGLKLSTRQIHSLQNLIQESKSNAVPCDRFCPELPAAGFEIYRNGRPGALTVTLRCRATWTFYRRQHSEEGCSESVTDHFTAFLRDLCGEEFESDDD